MNVGPAATSVLYGIPLYVNITKVDDGIRNFRNTGTTDMEGRPTLRFACPYTLEIEVVVHVAIGMEAYGCQ